MKQRFTDEQMQMLVNIVISCERWAKLEFVSENLNNYSYGIEESEKLNQKSIKYNEFMLAEMANLSGRDINDPYINSLYDYKDTVDKLI